MTCRRLFPPLLLVLASGSHAAAGAGTEFWAVLSDQSEVITDRELAVGNPDPSLPATVTVETDLGVVATATVPAGETVLLTLGWDRKASGSVLARLAVPGVAPGAWTA